MPRRSGRYPYGSGENPYQHSGDFLSRVQELKKSGMSEIDIAKNMGLTTTQLRTQMSLAKDERRALQVATAMGLREKGYSLNEIAAKMGFSNDSSVRSLLNESSETRMNTLLRSYGFMPSGRFFVPMEPEHRASMARTLAPVPRPAASFRFTQKI